MADMVLLGADPLADIRNTRQVEAVMYRGTWLDADGRAALLETMRRRANP